MELVYIIEFTGDVCFSGMLRQQIYTRPMEDGGEPVTGLVYEKYKNGRIAHYGYYNSGIENGEFVMFYESTKIKEYFIMRNGQILGSTLTWYESGSVKSIEYRKYSIVTSYEKWDENGNLIDKKTEPDAAAKRIIEKYDSIGFNRE